MSLSDRAAAPAGALPFPARRLAGRAALYLAVTVIGLWSVLPFLWLLVASFSNKADLLGVPPRFWPFPLRWDNYATIFGLQTSAVSVQVAKVGQALLNSTIVASVTTLVNLVVGGVAGYAYARFFRFGFMRTTLQVLMMTRMIPGLAIIVPWFILFRKAGLVDTKLALILTYTTFILPLVTWMLKGYFQTMPRSLEWAARVDGCTRLQAFVRVIVPVSVPGLVATGIFSFLVCWNEFLFALNLTGSPKAQTIPLIIAGLAMQTATAVTETYGALFAAGVVAVLPPVLIALFLQKWLIQGMLSGSSR